MVKAHSPIKWKNEPSTNTPINEANLNKMDSTIGVLDDRIIEQETSKLDKSTAYTMIKDISFNENNGIFTVTRLNGSTFTIDTRLEKIAINFKYDYSTQKLIVTLIDGTTQSIDMSALLTQYEFTDSATLDFTTDSSGKVTATIKNGSITEDMLQPNYLAEIKVETAKSAQSMANAQTSENNAKQSELNAKASEEQALEYSNNAKPLAQSVSGKNPTATNSADGNVVYLNNKGYQQQQELAFDGQWTTIDNGIKTTNLIPCENGDVLTVKCESGVKNILLYDANGDELRLIAFIMPMPTYREVTIDKETSGGVYVELDITDTSATILVNGNQYQTPSPDNPIRIGGLADKGYFDGRLTQGYRAASTGVYAWDNRHVTNTNGIECESGDVINVEYEGNAELLNIVFYDKDNTYISGSHIDNANEFEMTAPTNAKYVYFTVKEENITPSTAKHISVTINGMYALRVKTQNKNLCPTFEKSVGANASYYTDSFSVKGDSTYTISFIKERISGSTISNNNLYGYAKVSEYDEKMNLLGTVSGTVASLPSGIHKFVNQITTKPQTKHIAIDFNNNNGESALNTKVYNVQVEEGEVATPYEPHQESEALIPVSAPFYDGDFIEVYADGSGQIARENVSYIVDGSETITIHSTNDNGIVNYQMTLNTEAHTSGFFTNVKSTHLLEQKQGIADIAQEGIAVFLGLSATTLYLRFSQDRFSTVEELNAWLQSNPVTVVYELATPTSTPLTAEQVAEFMKLQTFKGVTHVTADGEVSMRYYCNNDSGDTVSMLQGRVEDVEEKTINISSMFVTKNTKELVQKMQVNETRKVVFQIPDVDGYTPLAIVGTSITETGVAVGTAELNLKAVIKKAIVTLTNHNDTNVNSSFLHITVLYVRNEYIVG